MTLITFEGRHQCVSELEKFELEAVGHQRYA